jgi:phosphonopyruvate decarboxylase
MSEGVNRQEAIPALLADHKDMLIVTGLAGSAKDIGALTEDADNTFTMAGAMGGATAMGLGLALAQPDRKVVVVTGDGELLMNMSSLATVAVAKAPNLSIVCVDNGHYQETGDQASHTSQGVDLAAIAAGSGIKTCRTVTSMDQVEDARSLLAGANDTCFIHLRIDRTPPPTYRREMDAAVVKTRFRKVVLGTT